LTGHWAKLKPDRSRALVPRVGELEPSRRGWFSSDMGRLLDKLLEKSPAYDIRQDKDGFVLIGKPGHIDEFSDLVREAADHAGEEFVVFTTSDGHQGYSQMFVMPLNEMPPPQQPA
jgi:hypothetical protein